ncbi:MAG: FAD-binding protein [Eggerthellaceae bacterium]|nr:FAD-binding protein [Eggerthellaceae bacterium]
METSRRDFLKLGGMAVIAAGAAGMVGCGSQSNADAEAAVEGYVVGAGDISWVDEADVIIVGTGITGLSAAIAPIKAGKKVVVLEKRPS